MTDKSSAEYKQDTIEDAVEDGLPVWSVWKPEKKWQR